MNDNQLIINTNAIALFHAALTELEQNYVEPKQFRTCTAWTYETDNFIILQSYKHYVAVYDKNKKVGADVLRHVYGYTVTSAQHIAKFFSDIAATNGYKWRSNMPIYRFYNLR